LSASAQLSESVATDRQCSFCLVKDIQKAPHCLQMCAHLYSGGTTQELVYCSLLSLKRQF
jgi:hypothetical protein